MDFLDEDSTLPACQNIALISVVSPQSTQKSNISAVKIKGVFDNKEDAKNYVDKLMKIDDSFDIYMVEMGKWLAIPPNISSIEEQEYQEQQLNNIIKGHKEQQLLAKSHFESRKRDEINKSLEDNLKDIRMNVGMPISEKEFTKLDESQQLILNTSKNKIVE